MIIIHLEVKRREEERELTVLTVTRKGVAAAVAASMAGVALSAGLPGMLRRRPVLSGGDSVDTQAAFTPKVDFFSKWSLLLFTISLPVSVICMIIYALNSLQMKPDDFIGHQNVSTLGHVPPVSLFPGGFFLSLSFPQLFFKAGRELLK